MFHAIIFGRTYAPNTQVLTRFKHFLVKSKSGQAANVSLTYVFEEIRERRVAVLQEKYGIDAGDVSNLSALGKLNGH